jgi:iron complex outermembrane receptor protein
MLLNKLVVLGVLAVVVSFPYCVNSQDGLVIEEITVTARKRAENLQEVPDSITAFTAETIERSGIEDIRDFFDRVPNMTFQDRSTYRKGDFRLSIRGINNGQHGWPSVSYLVDGVRLLSTDDVYSGMLYDLERIEVLRGPQSALYGPGAIGGAINIITKAPTNESRAWTKLTLGKGSTKKIQGGVSGALEPDRTFYNIAASFYDTDGLIDSASTGEHLAKEEMKNVRFRLIHNPDDSTSLDFRVDLLDENIPSTIQGKLVTEATLNVFDEAGRPRRTVWTDDWLREDRDIKRYAFKFEKELDNGNTIIATSAYSEADQEGLSSVCWDDVDSPAVDDPATPGFQVACIFPFAYFPKLGSAAGPGQAIDEYFDAVDDMETFTQDIRLVSSDEGSRRWIIGMDYMERKTWRGFDLGLLNAPDYALVPIFGGWYKGSDQWIGIYGQLSLDLSDKLELTLNARYDDAEAKNTNYTTQEFTTITQVLDKTGNAIDTQIEGESEFQPKLQLAYQRNENTMFYATLSRGFRAGFFVSGNYTLGETTDNYEIGFKSTRREGRVVLNGALFHIDYSDQQFSTIIGEAPFRVAVTIPEASIDGFELEGTILVSENLTMGFGLGLLDAEVKGGMRSPDTSNVTSNLFFDYSKPMGNGLDFMMRADYRNQGNRYLEQNEQFWVPSSTYIDLRLGVEGDNWSLVAWSRNITDERAATGGAFLAGGVVRIMNRPTSNGVTFTYKF